MKKTKYVVYPAVFHADEDGYWVEFPDLPGCVTEGDDAEDAYLMAGDALRTYLSMVEEPYPPTPYEQVEAPEGAFVQLVRPWLYVYEDAKRGD